MKLRCFIVFFIVYIDWVVGGVVSNGSFEQGLKNWKCNGGDAGIEKENGRPVFTIAGNSGRMSIQQKVKTATVRKTYQVILEMKAAGDFSGEFYSIKPRPPWTVYYKKKFDSISSEFKKYVFTVEPGTTKTPEDAVFRIVFLGKGKVFIKSIRIGKGPARKLSDKFSGNLLEGSGFELGDGDYTVGWSGYMRELGGYRYVPEFLTAINKIDAIRKYNYNDKIDGRRALELVHDRNNIRTILQSSPVLTGTPGSVPVIFSVYMKSLQGKANVELSLKSGMYGQQKVSVKQKFLVDDKWRQYHICGKVDKQGECGIVFNNRGRLLIDAAMLNTGFGDKPGQYVPHANFDCFVSTPEAFGVSFKGNNLRLEVNCINRNEVVGELDCILKILNYRGQEVKQFKLKLAEGTAFQKLDVDAAILPVGYYKISCRIFHEGKEVSFRENAVGIIPRRNQNSIVNTPFGIHCTAINRELRLMKMIGVSMVRTHRGMETKWQVLEPEKGKFRDVSSILKRISDNKLNILGSLDYTPDWACSSFSDFPSMNKLNVRKDNLWYWARLFPPRDFNDMICYVEYAVSHYKKYIKYWETWNEVHLIDKPEDRINKPIKAGFIHLTLEELLDYSHRVYQTVKKENPEAVVVGQYASKAPYEQFDKVIKAGALNYVDKLAVHFYQGLGPGTPPDESSRKGYPTLRRQMEHWKTLMEQNGRKVGIWDTEFGICRVKTNYRHWKYLINWDGCSQERTLAYLVKSYLVRMSLGIEKIFYYSFSQPSYIYSYNPFTEFDHRPQPSLVAFAVMTKLFGSTAFCPDPVDDELCHIIKTRTGNGYLYAVWLKSTGDDIPFILPHKSGIEYLDIMGNAITGEINITTEPVYIKSRKDIDRLLVDAYRRAAAQKGRRVKSNEDGNSKPDIVNTGINQ